ncbi:MAG: DUF3536 domain-containing protein [Candidatus Omnitrophota bacterium]
MNRYLCVHGHFYQPPRENPWLEEVEIQDSAYPYHDWNDRINIECYAPNTAARILDRKKKIMDIVNNYQKISFNFGPTLLSWLEKNRPDTYGKILEADKKSQSVFSGHGSAIAQVYNHMIMPLANSRDKRTQIIWGIKDFEYRFARKPEGMWLAETAVDLETLEIMAEAGIKFTILSPYQAQKSRKIGQKDWIDARDGKIDPKFPYQCLLASGRVINIFFYDGPVARDVAFGGLLSNGENFAHRLLGLFGKNPNQPQLVHVATDGETYGHHHNYGEMALAYGYYYIEKNNLARVTIYAEFLEKFVPTHEVQIIENSSWSCFHGVDRWRDNCGCHIGTNAKWNQKWRKPLREAMDWLRDELSEIYEQQMSGYTKDFWQLRDNYIDVVLSRAESGVDSFLKTNLKTELKSADRTKILKLLEMQRHAMLMYTSCGWYFDDISNIETVQVMHYAGRAIQLAKDISGIDLEAGYLKILRKAKSNISGFENGEKLYEMFVKPTCLNLIRVGAHYAISSLFGEYPASAKLYCYQIDQQAYERLELGKQKIVLGSVRIKSDVTFEEKSVAFAILHLGGHIVFGGLKDEMPETVFLKMQQQIKETFQKGAVSEVISLFDRYFDNHNYTLWHLFRDEQRRTLSLILETEVKEIETSFRQIIKEHYPIMLAVKQMNIPLPAIYSNAFEFVVNKDLKNILQAEELNFEQIQELVNEVGAWDLNIDKATIGFIASKRIKSLMDTFNEQPENVALLQAIRAVYKKIRPLNLPLRVWEAQNTFFSIGQKLYEPMQERARQGELLAKEWVRSFKVLGIYLWVRGK